MVCLLLCSVLCGRFVSFFLFFFFMFFSPSLKLLVPQHLLVLTLFWLVAFTNAAQLKDEMVRKRSQSTKPMILTKQMITAIKQSKHWQRANAEFRARRVAAGLSPNVIPHSEYVRLHDGTDELPTSIYGGNTLFHVRVLMQ